MRILLKDICSNPYRELKQYPIARLKVNALKTSIKGTTFWDNILVRPHPIKKDRYELAYGHHRLVACKELKIKEVDIPVRELSDLLMVQIMVEENLTWTKSPTVLISTVSSVRKFLNKELAKYRTFEDYKAANRTGHMARPTKLPWNDNGNFQKSKKNGAGYVVIKTISDNWSEHMIKNALRVLDDQNLDKKVIEILGDSYKLEQFQAATSKLKIPKAKQKTMAKTLNEKKVSGRNIGAYVEMLNDDNLNADIFDYLIDTEQLEEFRIAAKINNVPKAKQKTMAKNIVEEGKKHCISDAIHEYTNPKQKQTSEPKDPDVRRAEILIEKGRTQAADLNSTISEIYLLMEKLKITELGGLDTMRFGLSMEQLIALWRTVNQNTEIKPVVVSHQLVGSSA